MNNRFSETTPAIHFLQSPCNILGNLTRNVFTITCLRSAVGFKRFEFINSEVIFDITDHINTNQVIGNGMRALLAKQFNSCFARSKHLWTITISINIWFFRPRVVLCFTIKHDDDLCLIFIIQIRLRHKVRQMFNTIFAQNPSDSRI